jgi:TolB-like protein
MHLRKVLVSGAFANADRMRRFLEFVVEHTLRSPDKPLKEVIIGLELYSRDFDPRISAAVRVDAARLRAKLREYYGSEGAAEQLIIELPKGGYTPTFRENSIRADSAPAGMASAEPSIAVLPFSNLSPEPEDYFSDGLTEEIIHALSSTPGIRVVARTSAFALKHMNADVREVGRALKVGFVLEGTVRKWKKALRVTAHLVSTTDGYQLWSRRYDRQIDDVFAVQDEIASAIAGALQAVSTPSPAKVPPVNDTGDFEAYEWYLRGRHHLNRQTRESLHRAIHCFERALVRSPKYVPAFSGMAVAWLYLGLFAMDAPIEMLPKAREAAARALEINDHEGEALSVAASCKAMFEWDWTGAEALFWKSLHTPLGSDLSEHLFAMFVLLPMARIEEALTMINEAKRIDPLSLFVAASKTAVLLMARRTAEAEVECRRALELDASFWRAIVGLGRCHEAQGRYDEAIACFERAKAFSEGVPTAIGALGRVYALAGRTKDAYRLLQELDDLAQRRYVSPYGRALIYLGLNDDKVFEWLERSYNERAGWLMYLATDPRFDPLRQDARFRALLQRLGLPVITYRTPVQNGKASV